jgi:hypothetical protein
VRNNHNTLVCDLSHRRCIGNGQASDAAVDAAQDGPQTMGAQGTGAGQSAALPPNAVSAYVAQAAAARGIVRWAATLIEATSRRVSARRWSVQRMAFNRPRL